MRSNKICTGILVVIFIVILVVAQRIEDNDGHCVNCSEYSLAEHLDSSFERFFRTSYEQAPDIFAQVSLADSILRVRVTSMSRKLLGDQSEVVIGPLGDIYSHQPIYIYSLEVDIDEVIFESSSIDSREYSVLAYDQLDVKPGDYCVLLVFDGKVSPLLGTLCVEPKLHNQVWNYQLLLDWLLSLDEVNEINVSGTGTE